MAASAHVATLAMAIALHRLNWQDANGRCRNRRFVLETIDLPTMKLGLDISATNVSGEMEFTIHALARLKGNVRQVNVPSLILSWQAFMGTAYQKEETKLAYAKAWPDLFPKQHRKVHDPHSDKARHISSVLTLPPPTVAALLNDQPALLNEHCVEGFRGMVTLLCSGTFHPVAGGANEITLPNDLSDDELKPARSQLSRKFRRAT